jgi:hypothetical protein
MLGFGLSYWASVLISTLYPMYSSFKAINSPGKDDDTRERAAHVTGWRARRAWHCCSAWPEDNDV